MNALFQVNNDILTRKGVRVLSQEKEIHSVEETDEILQNDQNTEEISEKKKEKEEKNKEKKKKKNAEQEELEKLKAEYDALNDKFLRMCAEYDNFRKRTQAEKQQSYSNALSDAISAILPVRDNIDRALAQSQASIESLTKGIEMISNQFDSSFEALGVKAIGEKGETFNPEFHNAVSHVEDEELGENVIAEVLQKGYVLNNEKVIRHAMVQVAN